MDFATIKYSSAGDMLWVRRYNGPGNGSDYTSALAVDNGGNIYVTGSGFSAYNYDYTTIKYDPDGALIWIRTFDGLAYYNDYTIALAVDDSDNAYVTGNSVDDIACRFGCVYLYSTVTIKYGPGGDSLWVRRSVGNDPSATPPSSWPWMARITFA